LLRLHWVQANHAERKWIMEKLTTAAAKDDFDNMVKLVTEENKVYQKVYQIESAEDSVILMSYKEYESLQETVELLSIPGFRESLQLSLDQIKNNETFSLDEVLGDIDSLAHG
jgi:antitoxin YefM